MPATEPVSIVEISSALPGAVPVWVDVSSSFRAAKTRRGKQRQLTRSQAGTATFVFSNADRKFDPENAAGPLFAFLGPMRRIRLRATWNAITYPIFDGYIDFIEQSYNGPHEATATIAATDGFKRLESAYLPSVWGSSISSEPSKAWFRLDEITNDFVSPQRLTDRSGNGNQADKIGPVNSVAGLLADDANTGMKTPNTALGGIGLSNTTAPNALPWAVEFWMKAPRYDLGAPGFNTKADIIRPLWSYDVLGVPGTMDAYTRNADDGINVDQLTVAIGNSAAPSSSVRGTKVVFDNATHHVVIVAEAGIPMKIYIDGLLSVAATVGNSEPLAGYGMIFGVAPLEVIWDEIRIYQGSIPNAAAIAAHYANGNDPWAGDTPATRINRVLDLINWPVADRALSATGSPLQRTGLGGTALDHLLLIEETELGAIFMDADGKVKYIGRDELITGTYATSQATFGDGAGELGYIGMGGYRLSDDTVRNVIRRHREGGAEVVASDATSQTLYGPKDENITGTQETSDTVAQDRANYRLAHAKDAVSYVDKLEIQPRTDPAAMFPVVLGTVALQSRITLKRRPQLVGAVISKEAIVQGIEHDIGPKKWLTRFYIDTTATQRYFLFNVTLWDASDWRFSSS